MQPFCILCVLEIEGNGIQKKKFPFCAGAGVCLANSGPWPVTHRGTTTAPDPNPLSGPWLVTHRGTTATPDPCPPFWALAGDPPWYNDRARSLLSLSGPWPVTHRGATAAPDPCHPLCVFFCLKEVIRKKKTKKRIQQRRVWLCPYRRFSRAGLGEERTLEQHCL